MNSKRLNIEKFLQFFSNNFFKILIVAFCIIAIISRLYLLFNYKDFWVDEAMVAVGIHRKNILDFFGGNFFAKQAFPLGFGLVNKVFDVYSIYEPFYLYIIPTILGTMVVLLTGIITYKNWGIITCLISLFLISLCKMPLYYSSEFKPYIYDAFVSLALIYIFSTDIKQVKEKQEYSMFFSFKYPCLFVISALFSYASLFIVGAISFCIFYFCLRINDKKIFLKIYKYIIAFLLLAIYYYFYVRSGKSGQDSTDWNRYYIPLSLSKIPNYITKIFWPCFQGLFTCSTPIKTQIMSLIVLVFFPIGLFLIWKKDKFLFFPIFLIFFIVFVVAFRFYPFGMPGMLGARTSLYLNPILIICSSVGISVLFARENKIIISLVFPLMLVFSIYENIFYIQHKMYHEQHAELCNYIFKNKTEKTEIFVYSGAVPHVEYWKIYSGKSFDFVTMNRDFLYQKSKDISKILYDGIFDKYNKAYFLFTHYWGGADKTIRDYLREKKYKYQELKTKGGLLFDVDLVDERNTQ